MSSNFLQDYTLMSIMTGHKSIVSSLAVCNGILYSGSWDGTIRLWSLNDHTPLAVLGEDRPGNFGSVLSLAVDGNLLVVAHENGHITVIYNLESGGSISLCQLIPKILLHFS